MKAVIVLAILYFIFFVTTGEKNPAQPIQSLYRQTVSQPPQNPVAQRTSEHAKIDQTLRKVTEQLRQRTDVNGDGLVNCIDAAVLFYQYYPDRNNVRIMRNINPATDFNHLFISVYTEGKWQCIEPQAYYTNHRSYWMQSVWGRRYISVLNSDATQRFSVYAK